MLPCEYRVAPVPHRSKFLENSVFHLTCSLKSAFVLERLAKISKAQFKSEMTCLHHELGIVDDDSLLDVAAAKSTSHEPSSLPEPASSHRFIG